MTTTHDKVKHWIAEKGAELGTLTPKKKWTLRDSEAWVRAETRLFDNADLDAVDRWFAVSKVHISLCSADLVDDALEAFEEGDVGSEFWKLSVGCCLGPSFFSEVDRGDASGESGVALARKVFGGEYPDDLNFTLDFTRSNDLAEEFWGGICDHVADKREPETKATLEDLLPNEVDVC